MKPEKAIRVLRDALEADVLAPKIEKAIRALMPVEAPKWSAEHPDSVEITLHFPSGDSTVHAVTVDDQSQIQYDWKPRTKDDSTFNVAKVVTTGEYDITVKLTKIRLVGGSGA